MEVIKMIASVAGEEVFVGECHPARARVLVKKQLASWKDGKILLHVLSVHDKMLESNPHAAHGPLDDKNVSKAELERRLAWFRSFMEKSTQVLAKGNVALPTLEEVAAWRQPDSSKGSEPWAEVPSWDGPPTRTSTHTRFVVMPPYRTAAAAVSDAETKEYFHTNTLALSDLWAPESQDGDILADLFGMPADAKVESEDDATDEDVAAFLREYGLEVLWLTDPDVNAEFRVPSVFAGPQVTEAEYQERIERDRLLLQEEVNGPDYADYEAKPVATLDQVLLYQERRSRMQ